MIEVSNPFEEAILKEAAKDVRTWQAFPKQKAFIQLPFDITEGFFGGAAGPGKSELLVLLPLIYRFHEHPLYRGILFRRTMPELDSEIVQRARQYYPSAGGVYNETKRRWKFPSGALEQFGYCEREQDVRKYDTTEYNLVRYDEATSFLPFQYLYIVLTRRRSKTADLPAIARSASNPGNIGHLFFRKRFIDPYPLGGMVIRDKRTNSLRYFLQALGKDNPILLANNPYYFSQMKDLGDAEYRAKALGDWYTFSGQAFPEWRLAPIEGSNEPSYARHVIPYQSIPSWWPRFLAIDWGWAAWTFAIWAALSPEGRLYIYRTYAEKGKYIKQWANDLVDLTGDEIHELRDTALCHSASQHRGEPQTIQQQAQEVFTERVKQIYGDEWLDDNASELVPQIRLGKRDRLGGKMLVHEFLRWEKKPKAVIKPVGEFDSDFAQWLRRNKGERHYASYCDMFVPEMDETNLPRLQILETTPEGRPNSELIDCIPACKYVEKGEKDKSPEDVAEFDGDDPYDCLRILLEQVNDYIEEVQHKGSVLTQRQKIQTRLENTGDYHSYALQMQKIESESNSMFGIRRFHRHARPN